MLRLDGWTDLEVGLRWSPASDALGIARYEVQTLTGTTWVTNATAPPQATVTNVRGLRPGTTYVMRIRAVDTSGNTSQPSAPLTFTTSGMS